VTVAQAGDATSAKAAHVAATKSAHVAATKSTHVASAKPATHVASTSAASTSAAAATTASLCTRGKKAPGKQRACQNHHRSSSHDILHLVGRTCRHSTGFRRCSSQSDFQRRDAREMGMLVRRLY
jgi:hypothetical protein